MGFLHAMSENGLLLSEVKTSTRRGRRKGSKTIKTEESSDRTARPRTTSRGKSAKLGGGGEARIGAGTERRRKLESRRFRAA